MKITKDATTFGQAALDTPMDAVCVKKRGKNLEQLCADPYGHGKIVHPPIHQQATRAAMSQDHADAMLYDAIMDAFHSDRGMVTVRGHGWGFEEPFVWTGTLQEFKRTWCVD